DAVDLVDFGQNRLSSDAAAVGSDAALPEALRLLDLVGTEDDPYGDGGEWSYANENGGRCFFITQNLVYPVTGRVLITTEEVAKRVQRKGNTRWAWILHDKDVYGPQEVSENPALTLGAHKADHVHIAISRKSYASVADMARMFEVPPQQVEPRPPSAFLDLVEYLTHENDKQLKAGKHLYDDNEVHASFDWRPELDEHKEDRREKGLNKALKRRKKEAALKVNSGEWTLDYVRQTDPELWTSPGVMRHLQDMRRDYLRNLPEPELVLNFYIFGPGGVGKDLLAMALARALYRDVEHPAFTVKSENVSFEGYDGEPVLIWSDFRAGNMLKVVGGRGPLFSLLEPHRQPDNRVTVNIKYGSVHLVNQVNIITGPEDYAKFLDGLAGEYTDRHGTVFKAEDTGQAWRRFPIIIPVSEGEFSVWINRGVLEGTREYRVFEEHNHLRQSLEHLHRSLSAIEDEAEKLAARDEVERQTVAPIVAQVERLHLPAANSASKSITAEFADAGQPLSEAEVNQREVLDKAIDNAAAGFISRDEAKRRVMEHFNSAHFADGVWPQPPIEFKFDRVLNRTVDGQPQQFHCNVCDAAF
ncbi:Rep family protein, partial [Actinomyces sp. 565]|uniref:Rep family protein n=1 Tax=Actinomyces sp. 565 TaxID=2057794 RepID=UPI00193A2392